MCDVPAFGDALFDSPLTAIFSAFVCGIMGIVAGILTRHEEHVRAHD